MKRSYSPRIIGSILGLVIVFSLFPSYSYAYIKITLPPDVDKSSPNNTCWLATAANMLAAAGYGISAPGGNPATNANLQLRADFIYSQLVAYYGTET
jgi:hypothetical protein